ncbi:MAG: cobyric acid synthase [Tissierellia bacterium]|nr:cobyric acid synthase [Tissierellia bacterium]
MKPLMIQGTTSSAGKSTLVSALARIFARDKVDVYPFKSQNMSSKYFWTQDGKRLATAQYIQAYAAYLEPQSEMNPILLVPETDMGSEVFVLGNSMGVMGASDYFRYRIELRDFLIDLFAKLKSQHQLILIEGAGSPAEINLLENDIVNMGMARIADADVLLVADIDRGGVFASIYGTIQLIPKVDRDRIKGLIINKFRGDIELLKPGLRQIEELTGIPVLGVVPFIHLEIADEDSLIDYQKTANCCFDPLILSEELDTLADLVEKHVDIEAIRRWIED